MPLRALMTAGVPIALGADDPLLFGPRLLAQYEEARTVHGLSDAELAALAGESVRASCAPRRHEGSTCSTAITTWLATCHRSEVALSQPTPTTTGSNRELARRTSSATPFCTSAASASRSAVVADPRFVSASVCLDDSRTRSLP